jgi:hypothetical protein
MKINEVSAIVQLRNRSKNASSHPGRSNGDALDFGPAKLTLIARKLDAMLGKQKSASQSNVDGIRVGRVKSTVIALKHERPPRKKLVAVGQAGETSHLRTGHD